MLVKNLYNAHFSTKFWIGIQILHKNNFIPNKSHIHICVFIDGVMRCDAMLHTCIILRDDKVEFTQQTNIRACIITNLQIFVHNEQSD